MIFSRYIFKNLLIATSLTAVTLAIIIFLTQSLRFLELVMDAGASSAMFWILTTLALPRFFEIILPIALMAAVVFIYNKLVMDSELIVARAAGFSPMKLAKPALMLAAVVTVILWFITAWLAPVSLSNMQRLRDVVKSQYSAFLFQDGVFNTIIPGLTIFVRDKSDNGELHGLMIYDSRSKGKPPVTVLADRGVIVATDRGQQVVVFDGSRQELNPKTHVLNRLDFERYTIDLPEDKAPVTQRWQEPDERTLWGLLNPDLQNKRDAESRRAFAVEVNRRLLSPLLALVFTTVSLCCMLLGAIERRGQRWRVVMAISLTVVIQGLFLAAANMARDNNTGLLLMYIVIAVPLALSGFMLGPYSEAVRQKYLLGVRGRLRRDKTQSQNEGVGA